MKRFSVLFLMMVCFLGFGLLLTSCDNGTTSSAGDGVVGTWVGQYIFDGMMVHATFVVRPDFTFTETAFVPASGITIEHSGTYSVTGNIVTFRYTGGLLAGTIFSGTVSGNTMTFVGDVVITLTRQ